MILIALMATSLASGPIKLERGPVPIGQAFELKPGVWTPALQEDPNATDGWRAKAGMPPLAAYVATRSRGCAK